MQFLWMIQFTVSVSATLENMLQINIISVEKLLQKLL